MHNKIKAALLTALTFGFMVGFIYGLLNYPQFVFIMFISIASTAGVYLLYRSYLSMLNDKDK